MHETRQSLPKENRGKGGRSAREVCESLPESMPSLLRLFLAAALALPASSLLVQPRFGAVAVPTPRMARPSMQFGKPERDGLTRDNEPDEFFSTNMDSMTDEEKFKSPVVIGGLALLLAPFLVGAIALAFYR